MLSKLFGGGITKTIENVALEFISTPGEKAEASALMVKTLDPNGLMRRDISLRVGTLYAMYFTVMLTLLAVEFFCGLFGIGTELVTAATPTTPAVTRLDIVATTTSKVTDLFLPVTGLYGAIVTASFGVNYQNAKNGN